MSPSRNFGSKGADITLIMSASPAPTVVVVGTDHTIAPVALRERLALDGDSSASLLQKLRANDAVLEAAVLSTCNRTEVYIVSTDLEAGAALIHDAFACMLDEHASALDDLLIMRSGSDAVRHLCAVASGLESMVVAETQILGQVRHAIEHARELNTSGPYLGAAFRLAVNCGKRVRSETAFGRVDISAGSVLVELIAERGVDWPSQRVLLVGAGRMNAATAERMRALGARDFVVASRTPQAAALLAAAVGGHDVPIAEIGPAARRATIIVSATRSPGLMLTADMLGGRPMHPLIVADLAVPRDVDPAVGALPGVSLIDIDHLHGSHETGGLRDAITAASALVEESTHEWQAWNRTRAAVPLITELRAHVDQQRDIELTRALAHLGHLSDGDRAVVEEMAHRLVSKMFHHLAVRLKRAAADPELGDLYLEAVRFLFEREHTWRSSREIAPEDCVHEQR